MNVDVNRRGEGGGIIKGHMRKHKLKKNRKTRKHKKI